MPIAQIQTQQLSCDDLLGAVEQLNPFERERFVSRITAQHQQHQAPSLPHRESSFQFKEDSNETQFTTEDHTFYQSLLQIMSDSAQLTPYAPYLKEVFRYVSAHDETETVISLSLALSGVALIISLPDIERYNLSISVLEDSGLVLEFFLEPARVTCVIREQYAHIMWMQNDEVNQHVLQGADFSIQKASTHLQELLSCQLGIFPKKISLSIYPEYNGYAK